MERSNKTSRRTVPKTDSEADVSRRDKGEQAELRALDFLQQRGLITIQRNYSCRRGEIDLVMQDGSTHVFVEVRYRSNPNFGSAAESITPAKQQRVIAAAQHYLLSACKEGFPSCRFDVVAVCGNKQQNIEWIKDAFQLSM